MTRVSKDHFIKEWPGVFEKSTESPSGLVWKIPRGTNIRVGDFVGYKSDLGYWKVEYKNKCIGVHRIIYYLKHGWLDSTKVIDHIDGDPSNNSIDNLREITYEENSRNKKMSKANRSGTTGVHEIHEWIATWTENDKNRSKSFPVWRYGANARQLAEAYREQRIKTLNTKEYNYTERHGT